MHVAAGTVNSGLRAGEKQGAARVSPGAVRSGALVTGTKSRSSTSFSAILTAVNRQKFIFLAHKYSFLGNIYSWTFAAGQP
jgi:hypothetical protein